MLLVRRAGKAATVNPDHQQDIGMLVRAGYMTVAEIAEVMEEIVDESKHDRPASNEIIHAIQVSMEARRRELDVTIPSSYERLRQAFDVLEERGLLTRENYWCCQTCAFAAITDEIGEELDDGSDVRGFVFFHSQDTDRAVEEGYLLLSYGGIGREPGREGPAPSKEIGEEIVELLRSAEFAPEWSGSPNDPIEVPITWDKRPPADA